MENFACLVTLFKKQSKKTVTTLIIVLFLSLP